MDQGISRHLRDIQDIDPVSAWPPGPGWWLLLLGLVALVMLSRFAYYLYRTRDQRRQLAWHRDARRQLRFLKRTLNDSNGRDIISELSELLRRIAVARFGRTSCAGLHGSAWLEWLTQHDPGKFNWVNDGAELTTVTYAPPDISVSTQQVLGMIDAALEWTRLESVKTISAVPDNSRELNNGI